MSFLTQVTPLILTFDEAPNIARCLERLDWAADIVVLDSGSTDATQAICRAHPRVRLFVRPFDDHASQWNYGLEQTGIATPWVLGLDCDYMVTVEATREIDVLTPSQDIGGYWTPFRYAMLGRILRSGIYPPVIALFRRGAGRYVQDGHTQRMAVDGAVGRLRAPFIHDDRKPFSRWVRSQIAYARLEADKLVAAPPSGFRGWLRTRTPFAVFSVGFYCLIVRGGLFDGPGGWLYGLQRMIAEGLISAAYLDSKLRRAISPADR
ncbi:MAG: glycosyl transferase [Frankiales bacterium]|nr:glycosyl transferase [Frankiales bacterium]